MAVRESEHRLTVRPGAGRPPSIADPGIHGIAAGPGQEGLLFVPSGYAPSRPAPLVIMCHGAGSEARAGLAPLLALAEEAGVVLLAPNSAGATWDLLRGTGDSDAATIDALLGQVLDRLAIDPDRIALGGFSDGASYALSAGAANGDLFTHLIAFSPGFAAPPSMHGRPAVFISHGRDDPVLRVERCSRRIASALRDVGLEVVYEEFDGGHTVSPEVARHAAEWFLGERLRVPLTHEEPGEPGEAQAGEPRAAQAGEPREAQPGGGQQAPA
jgi:phospholipase/carboxylesterase